MTREEAIKILRKEIECMSHAKCKDCILEAVCDPNKTPYDSEYIEIYEMAIKALEQEPCEDAISCEAVCNIVDDIRDCISVEGYWAILERLKKLSSVNPQPKTGHWIDSPNGYFTYCSECGLHGDKGIYKHYGWCPKCGARMVEQQESEDNNADSY